MTNEEQNQQPRRRRRSPDEAVSPAGTEAAARSDEAMADGANDDPMAALERLESLTSSAATSVQAEPSTVLQPRVAAPVARSTGPRSRTAASAGNGRMVARVAAPVIFLVAVIAFVTIVFQSGMFDGSRSAVSPTPAATKAGTSHVATKFYKVKTGDTLSGIAVKFKTTSTEILSLNPKMSSSTLTVGERIRVPKP
jgi:LysM repeat protein